MSTQYIDYPDTGSASGGSGIPTYANLAAFPAAPADGTQGIALDTHTVYVYSSADTAWKAVATPGDVLSVGALDANAATASGLSINNNALSLQSADATHPGLVNTGAQTFAGAKTFSSTIVGSVSGSAASFTGSMVGDITGTQGATVVSKIAGVAVGTPTGTGNVVFSASPTFTGTINAAAYVGTGDITAGVSGSSTGIFRSKNSLNDRILKMWDDGTNAYLNATHTSAGGHPLKLQVADADVLTLDTNKNANAAQNMILGFATTATAAGTTSLTVGSKAIQNFTGTTTQTVTLPAVTTLTNGHTFIFQNQSTGSVTVQTSGGNSLVVVASNQTATVRCVDTTAGTGTASWTYSVASQAPGSVTSVALSLPSFITVSGSPVTTSGTLTGTLATQTANTAFLGPTSGGAAAPTFRALVVADLPNSGVSASKTGAYTMAATDGLIRCDSSGAAFTVTLPPSPATGAIYRIKKTDSSFNAVTVAQNASETIDGATSTSLNTQNECIALEFDGTNWQIIDRKIPQVTTTYTPTFTSFGTVASITATYRRVGDSLYVQLMATSGTNTATLASVTLPSGLNIDSAKLTAATTAGNAPMVGMYSWNGTNQDGLVLACTTTSTSLVYLGSNFAGGGQQVPANGSALGSNGSTFTLQFTVPISGWKG